VKSRCSSICRRVDVWLTALVVSFIFLLSPGVKAHDMPSDVLVQMFVKPSGAHLQVIVRIPLISLLNINLPKRGEDYLDLVNVEPALRDAAGATAAAFDLYENGVKLGPPRIGETRVSLPSDSSFDSFEQALAHVQGRLPVETQIVWNQGFFDTSLTYDIESDRSSFSFRPYFGALAPRVVTAVRFLPPDGVLRAFALTNDPGLVYLEPRWYEAAATFVRSGSFDIFGRMDHLLFLLCLVIPRRRVPRLIPVVSAFAAAASMAFIASAYQFSPSGGWFPPVIETSIAASIVFLAVDNMFSADLRRRSVLAFGFGLVHGFGFSFALRPTLQFAGSHLLTSLLSLAVAIALGQAVLLAALVAALTLLFRYAVSERVGVLVLSALVCHTAWHWMIERGTILASVRWPTSDLIEMARWATGAAVVASLGVLLVGVSRRLFEMTRREPSDLETAANERG
jgi:HupE / UreJ protein